MCKNDHGSRAATVCVPSAEHRADGSLDVGMEVNYESKDKVLKKEVGLMGESIRE